MESLIDKKKKQQRNIPYFVVMAILAVVLAVVIFYVIFVHLPYNSHKATLDEVRVSIIERDHLNYDGYFYEYNRDKTYYIMKAKLFDSSAYLAYDSKKNLVSTYSETPVSKKIIVAKIKKKYKLDVAEDDIKVGYEDDRFLYACKAQTDDHLYYFYYDLTGQFIKQYQF